jgi:hypothetical protein
MKQVWEYRTEELAEMYAIAQCEIERLRAALERIAKQDYDPFAADPRKWPSQIAQDALTAAI